MNLTNQQTNMAVSSVLAEVEVLDHHFHNKQIWVGKKAVQGAIDWFTIDTLTPFQCISGASAFGADANDEAQVVGSGDTTAVMGSYFDVSMVMFNETSNTAPYIARLVWGTGTLANAIIAVQYTNIMVRFPANARHVPIPFMMPRIAVGTKVWVQCKNATDNATMDFFVGLHFYPN